MRALFRRLVAAAAATVGLVALAPVQQAQAGTSCTPVLGCSGTVNYSGSLVLAVRDWTCSSGTTASASTGCVSLANTRWLSDGYRTPKDQDWDAFKVDAGWCVLVEFQIPAKKWHVTYDRRNQSSPVYVKVENFGTAYVRGQSRTSCP
ncbi:hypothetical protein KUM39_13010 [Streptomyces sp. J2-1]|uniref:hypothetical protein n=1 Tax=Streptomyces corallincola TaxID=2851888 RepID=UPI001C3827F1|nr:hypothetical protein [Streptomyces corallincola]MBV2355279.1 hypothetical protein [Streptomyces corallincola]